MDGKKQQVPFDFAQGRLSAALRSGLVVPSDRRPQAIAPFSFRRFSLSRASQLKPMQKFARITPGCLRDFF